MPVAFRVMGWRVWNAPKDRQVIYRCEFVLAFDFLARPASRGLDTQRRHGKTAGLSLLFLFPLFFLLFFSVDFLYYRSSFCIVCICFSLPLAVCAFSFISVFRSFLSSSSFSLSPFLAIRSCFLSPLRHSHPLLMPSPSTSFLSLQTAYKLEHVL